MKEPKPLVAITIGDPAGIGPEISVKALSSRTIYKVSKPVLIGDGSVVEQALRLSNLKLRVHEVSSVQEGRFSYGTIDL